MVVTSISHHKVPFLKILTTHCLSVVICFISNTYVVYRHDLIIFKYFTLTFDKLYVHTNLCIE